MDRPTYNWNYLYIMNGHEYLTVLLSYDPNGAKFVIKTARLGPTSLGRATTTSYVVVSTTIV